VSLILLVMFQSDTVSFTNVSTNVVTYPQVFPSVIVQHLLNRDRPLHTPDGAVLVPFLGQVEVA